MQVFLHNYARKYIERLDQNNRERIKRALRTLEKEPEGDIRSYEGNPGIRRLRVGGYRVLFKIENENTILVTHIEPRGQAYTKKTRKKRG